MASTHELRARLMGPNWKGPYRIIKEILPSTYKLAQLNNQVTRSPWNENNLESTTNSYLELYY